MRPSLALKHHQSNIKHIAERHHAKNARVFGAVLRGQDAGNSDLDLRIDPTTETTLMDTGAICMELRQLLGIKVGVLTPQGVSAQFRDQALNETQAI